MGTVLFTGREWITELGLYDYRNRVYSPDLGRFLQLDPIRFDAGDVNLYRYVFNNSVNRVDPEGLKSSIFGAGRLYIDSKCDPSVSDMFKVLSEDGDGTKLEPAPSPGGSADVDAVYVPAIGRAKKIPDNMSITVECCEDGTIKKVWTLKWPWWLGDSPEWKSGDPQPPKWPGGSRAPLPEGSSSM
jgi:RHS repeat-associated protein